MSKENKVYKITITNEGFEDYKGFNTSAETFASDIGIDTVLTNFQWEDDYENQSIFLIAIAEDGVSEEEIYDEINDNEYIDNISETKEYRL